NKFDINNLKAAEYLPWKNILKDNTIEQICVDDEKSYQYRSKYSYFYNIPNIRYAKIGSKRSFVLTNDGVGEIYPNLSLPISVKIICCGIEHTVLSDINGDVYVNGNNKYGQLGVPEIPLMICKYVKSCNYSDISNIKCGNYFTIIYTTDGKLIVFGDNR